MFSTLIESNRPRSAATGSLALSAIAHVLIVGAAVALTHDTEPAPGPSSFIQRVLFLPPPDKVAPSPAQGERLQYLSLGVAPGGRDGATDLETGGAEFGNPDRGASGGTFLASDDVDAAASQFVAGVDDAFSELEVDSIVQRYADSDAPAYPPTLLARAVEGVVFMRYVVDTLGAADITTAQVVSSSHPEFTRAVLAVLPRMRFRPAMIGSRPVRQLVMQEFAFRIQRPDTSVAATRPEAAARSAAAPAPPRTSPR